MAESQKKKNYFEELNDLNVSDKTEKKGDLTYLSWVFAWGELKKRHPDATYTVYENAQGWNYHTDGRTAWTKVGVVVNGIEHIEYLPIMDFKNRSIPLEKITSYDVNKAIQRGLTKAVARHGLGLYVFAGEDLPEEEQKEQQEKKEQEAKAEEAELKAKVLGYFNRHEFDQEKLAKVAQTYKVKDVKEMTAEHCKNYIARLEKSGGNIDE